MIKAYAASEPGGELKPFEYDPGSLARHQVERVCQTCKPGSRSDWDGIQATA